MPAEPGRVLLQLDGMASAWERWAGIVEEKDEEGRSLLLSLPRKVRQKNEEVNGAVARLRVLLEEELRARRRKQATQEG